MRRIYRSSWPHHPGGSCIHMVRGRWAAESVHLQVNMMSLKLDTQTHSCHSPDLTPDVNMNSTACFSRPALRPQSGNRDLSPVQSSRSIGLWEEIFSLSLRWINILHIGLLLISTWNQVGACVINTSVPLSWGIWRASWVSVFVCAQTNVPKWQVVSPLWSDNSSEMSTHQNTGRRRKKGDYSGWKAAAAKRGPCSSCVWLGINMKVFTRDSFELLHLCCKLRTGLYDKLANARSSIYQLLHPKKWCSTWLRFG